MEVLDFIFDIVWYILSDLVGAKQISAKAKKVILVAFIILSLCYIGVFSFFILWGIKEESIILSILVGNKRRKYNIINTWNYGYSFILISYN